MKDYLLKAFPNPERKGCPDEETIKALAERRVSLNDPAMLHIASCSECYAEYRNYRLDKEERGELHVASSPVLVTTEEPIFVIRRSNSSKWTIPLALAASLVCGIVGLSVYRTVQLSKAGTAVARHLVSSNPVPVNVDLFNAVTLRGGNDEPKPLQEVSLPAASVNLAVTLPRFSQSGNYTILVAKDRAGKQILAEGSGNTSESQGRVGVHVTLDLRKATPGAYFLATIRGSDNGTYYYPLRVD
jgi:hypothetical protein